MASIFLLSYVIGKYHTDHMHRKSVSAASKKERKRLCKIGERWLERGAITARDWVPPL